MKHKSTIEIIKDAGYVLVVRCKDCFYGEVEPDDNSYFFCTHPLHKLESHESSYFCADGEAKWDA